VIQVEDCEPRSTELLLTSASRAWQSKEELHVRAPPDQVIKVGSHSITFALDVCLGWVRLAKRGNSESNARRIDGELGSDTRDVEGECHEQDGESVHRR
jgi:hypothetical protein